jgi:hypothetical protein
VDKLHIRNEMAQLDRKNRDFYDELTEDERKKFSLYLMIRWSSTVAADTQTQEYYVRACNHYLNRHFFSINRHPKLQWLTATAVSPDVGTLDHHYIRPKSKNKGTGSHKKTLMKFFPTMKMVDIELLSSIVTAKELREFERQHGYQDEN